MLTFRSQGLWTSVTLPWFGPGFSHLSPGLWLSQSSVFGTWLPPTSIPYLVVEGDVK